MSEDTLQITPTADRPLSRKTFSGTTWAVSAAFWSVLLIAAALYGSVALTPRLSAWMDVRHDFITNAHQLKALETELDYLERVRDALQSDPDFVRQLAAVSTAPEIREGEAIPVSGSLIFGSEDQLHKRMPEIARPTGAAVVDVLARHRRLRTGLLAAAAVLVVFAFTVLNGSGGRFVAMTACVVVAVYRLPLARYCRVADDCGDEPAAVD